MFKCNSVSFILLNTNFQTTTETKSLAGNLRLFPVCLGNSYKPETQEILLPTYLQTTQNNNCAKTMYENNSTTTKPNPTKQNKPVASSSRIDTRVSHFFCNHSNVYERNEMNDQTGRGLRRK